MPPPLSWESTPVFRWATRLPCSFPRATLRAMPWTVIIALSSATMPWTDTIVLSSATVPWTMVAIVMVSPDILDRAIQLQVEKFVKRRVTNATRNEPLHLVVLLAELRGIAGAHFVDERVARPVFACAHARVIEAAVHAIEAPVRCPERFFGRVAALGRVVLAPGAQLVVVAQPHRPAHERVRVVSAVVPRAAEEVLLDLGAGQRVGTLDRPLTLHALDVLDFEGAVLVEQALARPVEADEDIVVGAIGALVGRERDLVFLLDPTVWLVPGPLGADFLVVAEPASPLRAGPDN
eukprot:scaffold73297_cov63-Phaeocystis_antarctica.AAC.2